MNTPEMAMASAQSTPSSAPRVGLSMGIPILAILATMVVTVVLVFNNDSHIAEATAANDQLSIQVSRDVRFEDQADGSVIVVDAKLRQPIETIAPASNGFLRGSVRGLVRERKRQGLGAETPFTIAVLSDGRLVLRDVATRREIDLASFGSTNAEVFSRLLPQIARSDKP